MPKQTKKNSKSKFLNGVKRHKLVIILGSILFLMIGNFAYNKYLDWDNAQMIKGLSRDFPALVEQIEQETGLELDIDSNCMTTQEKFSSGVGTCEFIVVKHNVDKDILKKQNEVIDSQSIFKKGAKFINEQGYVYKYRNKTSCEFSHEGYIYISCITGIRKANRKNLSTLLQ